MCLNRPICIFYSSFKFSLQFLYNATSFIITNADYLLNIPCISKVSLLLNDVV